MSIRLRMTEMGLVALCAARSVPKDGDVLLGDDAHSALSDKFASDFASEGFYYGPVADSSAMDREESNNPNRDEWDRLYEATRKTRDDLYAGMVLAVDYDGTFSRDPEFWKTFVRMARIFGHECVLVTGRSEDGEYGRQVKQAVEGLMPVVFAGPSWKAEAALKRGWKVDVWIDDNPQHIARQSMLITERKG